MHDFIDQLTFIATGPIHLRFFDASRNVTLVRDGQLFAEWANAAHARIATCFDCSPATGTPLKASAMQDLYSNNNINNSDDVQMTYWLTDGEPSDCMVEELIELVCKRPHPERTPLALLACGDDDDKTAWMKRLESLPQALFVVGGDDFLSNKQGPVLPYTFSMWLISQLVGALNPHDLDAPDDVRPFSCFFTRDCVW